MNTNGKQPAVNTAPPTNPPPAAPPGYGLPGPGQPANVFLFPNNPWAGMVAPPPPRGKGYAVSAAVSVFAGLAVFGVACYYLRAPEPPPPAPPAPPPEPQVIVKEITREVPTIVERFIETKPVEAPPPPITLPPPEPPAPVAAPPQPWTGVWRSAQAKASLRLAQTPAGIAGFYSPANGHYAPGDIERVSLSGDVLTFSAILGTRRYCMRMERDGETARLFQWVDIDGLREEYRKLDQMVARRQATVQQALIVRREIQAALKTAGPAHAKQVGVFTREDTSATAELRSR